METEILLNQIVIMKALYLQTTNEDIRAALKSQITSSQIRIKALQ
jgi:hypothetical protein